MSRPNQFGIPDLLAAILVLALLFAGLKLAVRLATEEQRLEAAVRELGGSCSTSIVSFYGAPLTDAQLREVLPLVRSSNKLVLDLRETNITTGVVADLDTLSSVMRVCVSGTEIAEKCEVDEIVPDASTNQPRVVRLSH